jgi:hypothetical protein
MDAPSPQLTLPKGWYTVRAKYQGIVSEMVSEVKAGTLYKYTVVAYAGKATFTAVDAKGKRVKKGAIWTIERVTKNNGDKREPVTTDSTASPSLLLGEGKSGTCQESGAVVGVALPTLYGSETALRSLFDTGSIEPDSCYDELAEQHEIACRRRGRVLPAGVAEKRYEFIDDVVPVEQAWGSALVRALDLQVPRQVGV